MSTNLHLWDEMVDKRNRKLAASDWTQFADSPLSDEKKNEWAVYRQSLRDIPSNYSMDTFLAESVWPTPP
jgi:hypothetical protein